MVKPKKTEKVQPHHIPTSSGPAQLKIFGPFPSFRSTLDPREPLKPHAVTQSRAEHGGGALAPPRHKFRRIHQAPLLPAVGEAPSYRHRRTGEAPRHSRRWNRRKTRAAAPGKLRTTAAIVARGRLEPSRPDGKHLPDHRHLPDFMRGLLLNACDVQ